MHNTQIKAVLFDLGETLLDFGRIKPVEVFAAGAKSSYDYLKSLNQPVGGFKLYFWRNLLNLRMQRCISWFKRRDFDALALLKRVGTKKGLRLSAEQWQYLAWLWYEPLSKIGRTEPQMKETLAALKEYGLKLGIVSNTFGHGTSLEKHLEPLGLLDFFTVRLYSYQFAFRKPDIRIFSLAAQRIGHAPRNILYVGDRIDKDIKPAIKSGMSAVLKAAYTNSGRKLPPGVRRIARISDLPGLIQKINTQTAHSI